MNIMVLSMPFNNSANFLKLVVNRRTDRQTDRQTDGPTDRHDHIKSCYRS